MSITVLKNKINKSISEMDAIQLKAAYVVLKEIGNQHKYANIEVDKTTANQKIAKGIQQLENGEGTDFRQFLNEMQASYGKK